MSAAAGSSNGTADSSTTVKNDASATTSTCKLVSHTVMFKLRGNDKTYEEAIEASSKYNRTLFNERRMRIPFIDSQTRVAQTNSMFWMHEYQRMRPKDPSRTAHVYEYPCKKWFKNRRVLFDNPNDHSNMLLQRMQMQQQQQQQQQSGHLASLNGFGVGVSNGMHYQTLNGNGAASGSTASLDALAGTNGTASSHHHLSGGGGGGGSASVLFNNENSNSMDSNTNHSMHLAKQMSTSTTTDYEENSTSKTSGATNHHNTTGSHHNHHHGATPSGGGGGVGAGGAHIDDWPHDDSFEQFDAHHDLDDSEHDNDMDDSSSKRKKKRGKPSRKAKAAATTDSAGHDDKPFACERCGVKYKTKPGLSYHVHKAHGAKLKDGVQQASSQLVAHQHHIDENTTNSAIGDSAFDDMNSQSSSQLPSSMQQHALNFNQNSSSSFGAAAVSGNKNLSSAGVNGNSNAARKCGVCHGVEAEYYKLNEQTQQQVAMASLEKFVSCHECARPFHPACLNFTANMIQSAKTYNWLCIECKKCTVCGNSENDDKLLFCDDCDRGYHMYCLKPALNEAPDGDWRCDLCVKQFGPSIGS